MTAVRYACRQAERRLREARAKVDSALGLLGAGLDKLDPRASLEERIGPRTHPTDIEKARAAKARREARGEGWGSG